jgi:hypothetical protein
MRVCAWNIAERLGPAEMGNLMTISLALHGISKDISLDRHEKGLICSQMTHDFTKNR